MVQVNCLSSWIKQSPEITHKEEPLGPGGLDKERADLKLEMFIQLIMVGYVLLKLQKDLISINSLATFVQVNKYGLETPYREVKNGIVTETHYIAN